MDKYVGKIICLTFLSLLLLSGFPFMISETFAGPEPVIKVIPHLTELHTVGEEFTVAVVVEDVTNLYGLDIQFSWNTTYLAYVSHKVTIPVEDNPSPIAPSPYAGILHSPGMLIKNVVNEAGVPGALLGTMYWLSYSSMAPATSFEGDGTAFVMTFKVKMIPLVGEIPGEYVDTYLHFVSTDLADSLGKPITHTAEDGIATIYAKPFAYPPLPLLKVIPEETKGQKMGETFQIDVHLMGDKDPETGLYTDLDPLWDIGGFDILMHFNPTFINATDITIDPDGWWASFWPGNGTAPPVYEIKKEINNTAGTVWVAFVGVPTEEGLHTPPYGKGRLFTVNFNVLIESETYPPPTSIIGLRNPEPRPIVEIAGERVECPVDVGGFPHPDRAMAPWSNLNVSVPIPHLVENATYTPYFKVVGRGIDLYTQYPYPYGGQGPNEPSDAFAPQGGVILNASITYNLEPVAGKTVTYKIVHGDFYYIRTSTSDINGIASILFRIPWPAENAEDQVFGIWNVTANVEIAGEVVYDTLQFEVGYLIEILSITPAKTEYLKGEHMKFTVNYKSISKQQRFARFEVTVYDELEVAIGRLWLELNVTYGESTFTVECMKIPKWAYIGEATVYANALTEGGLAWCPEVSGKFGIVRPP